VSAPPTLRDADFLALHEHFPDRYPVLLESVSGAAPLGQHDLLFALPGARLVQYPDGQLGGDAPGITAANDRFLDVLDRWFAGDSNPAAANEPAGAAPFSTGWFLYLGYELAAEIEPTLQLPDPRLPRALAWRMHGALQRDRATGNVQCVAETSQQLARLQRQLLEDLARLRKPAAAVPGHEVTRPCDGAPRGASRSPGGAAPTGLPTLAQEVKEEAAAIFLDGVREILDAIARGDVYQANLSRAWQARMSPAASITDLYRALRTANPAPFAALAQCDDFAVLSSSPERLLQIRDGVASTRPIAGTRPRGADAATDSALVAELRLNEKERAEHIMLVDLERNDLGRICKAGTVRVDEYMTIETYATVHHIVSNVRGELRADVTPGRAIAAVFPGGTITGCPKVRCMQILAGLEREPRDAYTGSLGYLGLDGSMDLNILIRTLTVRNGEIGFRTGAGIVADSDPEAELAETRAKARGVLRALGGSK
jgi:anthranilate synthase component I